jgi:IS5 family transposase
LTPGQVHDITQAEPLLEGLEPEVLLADKGYDSDKLVDTLEAREITPVIPSKANRREQRPRALLRAQPRRAVLQQDQAIPGDSYALRQTRQHVPRWRPARLRGPIWLN